MTEREILDGVIEREGGYTNDPQDAGGPTKYGITAATLSAWRHAPCGEAEVQALTEDEAREIYQVEFVERPGFTPANIPFESLRVQLIDFGVNSGPARAIRWLQRCMGFAGATVNGQLDSDTQTILQWHVENGTMRLLNDALVAARLYMIDQLDDSGALAEKFEEGVESRALTFFLAKP